MTGFTKLETSNLPNKAEECQEHSGRTRRKRRIAHSLLANAFGNGLVIADRFLLLPIMLLCWETEVVGSWFVVRSIPSFLSIGEMGFASITGNYMTDAVIKDEEEKARDLFWSTQKLLNCIGFGGILCTIIVAMGLPIASWFNCPPTGFAEAIVLSAVYIVSVFQTQLLYAAFRSIEMQAQATTAIQAIRFFELAIAVALLFCGTNLLMLSLAYAVVRILGIVVMRLWLWREARWLRQSTSASWETLCGLVRPAFGVAAISFAQTLQLQGFTLLLSAVASPTIVANYNALRTLARLPIQLGQTVNRTVWPELSHALASCNFAIASQLQTKAIRYTFGMTAIFSVLLLIFGEWLFGIWTNGELEFDSLGFVILVLSAGAISIASTAATLPMAASSHEPLAAVWCLSAITSIALGFCSWKYGVLGLLLIFLASDLAVLAFALFHSHTIDHQLKLGESGNG